MQLLSSALRLDKIKLQLGFECKWDLCHLSPSQPYIFKDEMSAYAQHYMMAKDFDGNVKWALEHIQLMSHVNRHLYYKGKERKRISKQTGFYILLYLRQVLSLGLNWPGALACAGKFPFSKTRETGTQATLKTSFAFS